MTRQKTKSLVNWSLTRLTTIRSKGRFEPLNLAHKVANTTFLEIRAKIKPKLITGDVNRHLLSLVFLHQRPTPDKTMKKGSQEAKSSTTTAKSCQAVSLPKAPATLTTLTTESLIQLPCLLKSIQMFRLGTHFRTLRPN